MKKTSDAKLTGFFIEHAKKHKNRFLIAFALMPACAGLTVLGPTLVKRAIDEGVATADFHLVRNLAFLYLGVVIVNFLLTVFQMLLMQTAGVRTLTDIRSSLLKHISFLPKAIFERKPLGIFVNRTTSDVEAIGETIATGLTNIITDLLTILAIVGVIFYHSIQLGVITIFLLPLIVVIVNYFRKKLRYHHNLIRSYHGRLMAKINETATMLFEVSNFHLKKIFQDQFAKDNHRYRTESIKAISYDALIYSVLEGMSFLILGVVFLFISLGVFQNTLLSIGQLIMYLQLLEVLFAPVKQMGQRFATIQSAFAALEKVDQIVKLERIEDSGAESVVQKDISFQNVSFGYYPDQLVLKDVSFQIPFGKSVAFVGPTGSGKSTIARLLTRQYEIETGKIAIGNVPIKEITREEIKKFMSMVLQEPAIFRETVKFNIGLGRTGATDDEIFEASHKMQADDFIQKMPQGYDTMLLGSGQLSAGQKQLLALAKAVVSKAEVLIFDEATANIDTQTELLIQKALDILMQEKTMIIIAHRLSTIRHVDHIFVLHHGKLIEEGNHEYLMKQKGLYSKMYQMQALE